MSLIANVPRDAFLAALASLQNVTGKKGTIAILANILIESQENGLQLTATDLEIGIRITLPAEILSAGSITLPARKLFELVRESGAEQLHIEVNENHWAKITADPTNYKLAGMPSEEYPAFPEYEEGNLVELATEEVKDIIDRTLFSVAQEGESQFNLTGLLMEKDFIEGEGNFLRMVSSDGHRLTMMERKVGSDLAPLKMDRTILIPKKGVQEIRKLCDAKETIAIGFEEKQAVVKADGAIVIIRLMNGDFPDYKNIIQVINKARHIDIPRIPLMNSLKRMNLFTEDRYNAVQFLITTNQLVLASQNLDIGSAKDQLDITYDDKEMNLGFNGKYFIEAIQVMGSEMVKAYINSEESPCLIQGDDDPGYLSVIMPMKI
ncbi:MAG: DNA polymerase III subunit beta [Thermodesulfobacteriota bacterium]